MSGKRQKRRRSGARRARWREERRARARVENAAVPPEPGEDEPVWAKIAAVWLAGIVLGFVLWLLFL